MIKIGICDDKLEEIKIMRAALDNYEKENSDSTFDVVALTTHFYFWKNQKRVRSLIFYCTKNGIFWRNYIAFSQNTLPALFAGFGAVECVFTADRRSTYKLTVLSFQRRRYRAELE